MLWRSHFLAGACAGLALAGHAETRAAVLYAGFAGAAALAPDLDSPRSYLGRKAPVSIAVNLIVGHRGVLHSLAAAAGVAALVWLYLKTNYPAGEALALPFAAGYLSHLALDTLTPGGVPWLWPLPLRLRLPLVTTGSFLEKVVIIPALAVLFAWLALGEGG